MTSPDINISAKESTQEWDQAVEDHAFGEATRIVLERLEHADGSPSESRQVDTNEIVKELLSTVYITRPTPSMDLASEISSVGDGSALSIASSVMTQEDELVLPQSRLAALIQKLLSKGRKKGVPLELQTGNDLARRMSIIFSFPNGNDPAWLWKPLFEGLMNGAPFIDTMVEPPTGGMPLPILAWLCQWKSMQKLFHWKGEDEIIAIALAAGANPNIKAKNGITPIFMAVKYGSLETVKTLVDAGANLSTLDSKKRTCLWNAIERPIPEIVTFLIERLPATELFPYHANGKREVSYQSAVDYLFASQLALAFDSEDNPEYPWSWKILGRPHVDDIAQVLIEFGRREVTFTPNDITLALLSFVLRDENPNKQRNRYPKFVEAKEPLQKLAKLFMGLWLPESIQQQIAEPDLFPTDVTNLPICKICNMNGRAERLKLYCGHSFCLACIKRYAEDNRYLSFCPDCRKPLCKGLTGLNWRQRPSAEVLFETAGSPFGPMALDSKQLKKERLAWNIAGFLRSDEGIRRKILQGLPRPNLIPNVELNSVVPVTDGKYMILLVPKDGPIVLPILLKSISVLAFVSTTSYCTLVSPKLVELFGLQRKCLTSNEFKSLVGDDYIDGVFTALQPFEFKIGDIQVRLDHALEAHLPDYIGIQLGVDFLQSGAWCLVDFRLDGETPGKSDVCATVDGFGHTLNTSMKREGLRYHARDGTTFRTPLLHLNPFKDGAVKNTLHISQDNNFQECSWCCQTFPGSSMLQDDDSRHYYCDEPCRVQASQIQP